MKDDRNYKPLEFKPLQSVVADFGTFEEAIRDFRLKVNRERIFSKIKEKQAYEKPSQKRRRKMLESKHRRMLESLPENKRLPKQVNNLEE